MTQFENGPAAGQVLQLKCAPDFLRVVEVNGTWDALDLPGDGPQPEETIYCYRRKGEAGFAFVDGTSKGKRWGMGLSIASYVMCTAAPPDDVMRDNDRWRNWCQDQAIDLGDKEEGKSMAKQTFDVVGGPADGKKYESFQPKPPIWVTIEDHKYIALRFARDPADGSKGEVTIFMLADTKPSDAMSVWRSRQSGSGKQPSKLGSGEAKDGLNTGIVQPDNAPLPTLDPRTVKEKPPAPSSYTALSAEDTKMVELARKYAATTHTEDPAKFVEMAENILEELGKIHVFVGRGRLMIELATRAADVKAYPAKYKQVAAPKAAGQSGRKSGDVKATPTAGTRGGSTPPRRVQTPEESAKSMGALPTPVDPDDEPW